MAGAEGFNTSNMNPQSQVHNAHIGIGTANLNCDTCHGFPANVVQVQNGSKPGEYIVCESCHAPPPDSFKPSMGNLITIHLSRNNSCTNCHNTDSITPTHPSIKAENGAVQIIKCENCHANPQQFKSHINGGKYCLNCHGNSTAAASITSTTTPVQTMPMTTYVVPIVRFIVKLDYYRSFMPVTQTIKAGDEVVWTNDGTYQVTLVSADGLFEPKLLDSGKRISYIFKKPGTYGFYLNENKYAEGTIIVEDVEERGTSPVNTPVSTKPASAYTSTAVKQRAQLQVTYGIGAGRTKQELTVTVNLKNIGNATASHINLTIDNPPELEAVALSGNDKIDETMAWKGELRAGEEHIAKYSVKAITGRNLEIPLKVTYAKISPDEKAKALGVLSASASTEQLLTPDDWEVISLVIKIAATVPGFEAILAAVSLLLVAVIWRNRR